MHHVPFGKYRDFLIFFLQPRPFFRFKTSKVSKNKPKASQHEHADVTLDFLYVILTFFVNTRVFQACMRLRVLLSLVLSWKCCLHFYILVHQIWQRMTSISCFLTIKYWLSNILSHFCFEKMPRSYEFTHAWNTLVKT